MSRCGRKAFKPTASMRKSVETLKAGGLPHHQIAVAVGCSRETLEQRFAEELATGHAKRRAEAITLLWRSARKGKLSAISRLLDLTAIAWTAPPQHTPGPGGEKPAEPVAQTVDSDWGDDLNPRKLN